MSLKDVFQKPHWQHFLGLPGLGDLATPAILAADEFFDFIATHGIAAPGSSDFATWALNAGPDAADRRLLDLGHALATCLPGFEGQIAEARKFVKASIRSTALSSAKGKPADAPGAMHSPVRYEPWDPIAPPARPAPVPRRVSVQPWELPQDWQTALRRAATGMPRNGVAIAPSIVKRMREKLCQLAWSARKAGLEPDLSPEVTEQYLVDLRTRIEKRRDGLRWATLRASFEELHRFSRLIGAPGDTVTHLSRIYWDLHGRERFQLALKHFRILETGHTTDSVLDLAEQLLHTANTLENANKRHRMRNASCILGLYPIAPLRNASAYLVFGETLFWHGNQWIIDTYIQKTARHTPERFVMPLEPETGRFIDAVILGDRSILLLPELRRQVQEMQRPLFILANGKPAAKSYAPRIFKALTGNSFTTTRSMLHTDEAIHNGEAGVDSARAACHQKAGSRIVEKYQLEAVMRHAVEHSREASRKRRLALLAKTETSLFETAPPLG
ncbi:hypothetical protein [Rhodovulum adriaticum]|uniref:Uncharacterized protein n=1 Tax=Rhodovulum adriaticum TaxID=35804 RepID=A0A4R2P172_RHOAD|nr:hypothetical protein [Rhodovulum adriaticum]MBK1634814.1 hypothetical protein [Rhodovulum adriaticum]TCP27611.1 hypothetical protein EV656_101520 [Rhodovulum adriaticum]